ncbi:hypothetical protein BDD12DRAFT_939507 [Trichophaea hybrida]|nr:hypothetical protein BDD12DRAFT_939507 [Trichophaea hybrida]
MSLGSQITTVRSQVSELQNRISTEALTLKKLESRIEAVTIQDFRLIRSALDRVIGAIHNHLLANQLQNPELTVAVREGNISWENALTQTDYGTSQLQEIAVDVADRLDVTVELTSTAFDSIAHFSAEATEYRGLSLIPIQKDVETARISIQQLQVVIGRRLRTVQDEKDDIQTNLKRKQDALQLLLSTIKHNEREIDNKQSQLGMMVARSDRLTAEAQQQRANIPGETARGWLAAVVLTVFSPPAGIALAIGTTVSAVGGFKEANQKDSSARRLQQQYKTLHDHTQKLRQQSFSLEREASSLSSDCSRHTVEISAIHSELSSVKRSQSAYNGFQQKIEKFSQRTGDLNERIRALQVLLFRLKSEMTAASLRLREHQNQVWMAGSADERIALVTGLADVVKTLESCHESVSETLLLGL